MRVREQFRIGQSQRKVLCPQLFIFKKAKEEPITKPLKDIDLD